MKGFIVCSLTVIGLTALSGCASYNWEKDYGTGMVSLDGPLRKNVTYVKGTTSFADATPAGMAIQAPVQQAPMQTASFAAPRVSVATPNYGVTNVARTVVSAPVSSGFIAPITAQPAPTVTYRQMPVAAQAPHQFQPVVSQPVSQVRVPPAFINAGQSANLQTRRVGNAGIVVFSDMIEESVAKSAASRSCAQEGMNATPTDAVSVATGVKQLNFTCG